MGASNTLLAIVAAVLAGSCLALTGLLQQRAASSRPQGEALSPRLLLHLARNRVWLLGLGVGFLAYAFQAVALAFGALALVQPIFLSELIFAVPISVRLHDMSLHAREWGGVAAVIAGLALGIAAAAPQKGKALPPFADWMVALGLVVVVAGAAVLVGRLVKGPVRASLYAAAGACVLAFQSALFNVVVALFRRDVVSIFTHWQGYALIPVTVVGVLLVQSAYQAGPLAASMPVMDAVLPCVAIALGVGLFGETISSGALNLAGAAAGLVLFFTGILLLDTSPVVHRLQRREDEQEGEEVELGTLREEARTAS